MMLSPEQETALRRIVSPTDRVEEVLCAQSRQQGYPFAVVRVKSGAICAVWERHACAYESLEEMLSAQESRGLNRHEKFLVELATKYGIRGDGHEPAAKA